MAWFEDQIEQRKKNDEQAYERALQDISNSISGKKKIKADDKDALSNSVIDEILNYYRIDFDDEDDKKDLVSSLLDDDEDGEVFIEDIADQLRSRLEVHGVMFRKAKLEDGWEDCAIGPMVALTENNEFIALIPNRIKGYTYKDFKTGKKVKVNKNIAKGIKKDCYCFYEPLPFGELKATDLLRFAFKTISTSDIILIVCAAILMAIIDLAFPIASNYLFSNVVSTSNISMLLGIAVALISLTIASFMFEAFKMLINTRINIKMNVAVDSAVMMRILSMPTSFFRKFSAGELTKRYSYVSMLCQDLLDLCLEGALTFVLSFIQFYTMSIYAPELIWVVLIIMALTIVVEIIATKVYEKANAKFMEADSKEYGISYSIIAGIQKIKLSGAEKRAFSKWGRFYARKSETTYNIPLFLKVKDVLITAISLIGMIVVYIVAYNSNLDTAAYYAFDASFGIFTIAFMNLAENLEIISSFKPTMAMIRPILSTIPEDGTGKQLVKSLRGTIELEHVCFSYGEKLPNIIDDLTLKIKSGEYVAIVGTTGCGKSTLLRLILGFEQATKGNIYFDGKDIKGLDLRSLRRKIGSVTQNGKLLQGSIYSNIVLNAPNANIDDAWKAAQLAGMAETIEEMPMGMHTIVSEGGGGISGGQRQRIMIARALISKPKILIFDEATSALDNITQKQVSDSLDSLNCTRIVVAHRLSTIRNCDRIIVLDKGKIIEDGSYDELIKQNGFFAELVNRQRLDTE